MAARAQAMAAPTDAELLEAQADLFRHSLQYLTSMSLQCAVKLGIPTVIHRLGGTASLPDLITALSLPPAKLPFLGRLMRLLVTQGVFAPATAGDDPAAGPYRLTPLSCLLVEGSASDNEGHTTQAPLVLGATSRQYVDAAMSLAEWFGKDVGARSPFEEVHGATLFDESMAEKDAEFHREINVALAAHDNLGIATLLRECRDVFQGLDSLTDCCGGDGTTARAVAKAFPHIKCTVLDLPKVIDSVPADGVVNYVAGDLFHSVPPAQAVMLKLVLHHWSDEDSVKILAQCKKAIPMRTDGGKVIVIDIVIDPSPGPTQEAQLLMDVAMMTMTKGRQRDEKDWKNIFLKAGFRDYKIIKMVGARGVFEVYP